MADPLTIGMIVAIVGTTIIGAGVTIWATKRSEKMTRESLSEAEKSRELATTQVKSQQTMFKTNTIIGIVGLILTIVTIMIAVRGGKK